MQSLWKTTVLVCYAVLVPFSASAQQLRGPRLDAAIDQFVEPLIALRTFSGVLLVARHDSVLSQRSYGLANVESAVPITRNSAFRIASVSKSFTRALIGRLADKSVLALDDRLSRWLPAFPSADRITLQMLLDHRAGVPNRNSLPYDEEARTPQTLNALIDMLARTPLDFPPDSTQRYSNGGYAVLAHVIERATGRPYADVLASELLEPLGLTHTKHQSDGELIRGLAHGMVPSAVEADVVVAAPYQAMATKTGGGSLVSTADDLLAWSRAIGTHSVLSRAMWMRLFPNDTVFTLDGRSPGYMTMVLRKGDMTAVVLANNYDALVGEIGSGVMALAEGHPPAILPVVRPATLQRLDEGPAGRYRVPAGAPLPPNSELEIKRVGENLVARVNGVAQDVLIPQAPNTYLLRNLWSMVTFSGPGPQGDGYVDVKSIYRNAAFRAARIRAATPLDTPTADVALSIYEAALRFYSPPPRPRQVRWLEKPSSLDGAQYRALLDRLDSTFRPWKDGDSLRGRGGMVRLGDIQSLSVNRWRVSVWYRHHQAGIVGPESMQTFEIERLGERFTVASRG